MKEIYRYLRITYVFIQKAIKEKVINRGAFLINCVSQAMDYAVTFILMWIMISAFEDMDGWNAYEVMLLYAFSLFSYGIAGTFFYRIMHNLPLQIKMGTFDDVLVKPVKVLPYLISSNFMCNYIAHISLSILVMVFSFRQLKIQLSILFLLKVIEILFMGGIIYSSFFLFVAGISFFFISNNALANVMFFFREISFYPISIFPKIIQVIVTVFIPYGFINYYPLRDLLRKKDLIFQGNISNFGYFISVLFFIFSCFFFCKSTKYYKSSGS